MALQRLHLIANKNSGRGAGESISEVALRVCEELGWELVEYQIDSPEQMDAKAEEAVQAALAEKSVVAAAGGDGTIRTVAQHASGTGVAFAAIPCGTFNWFARTHSIPENHEEAFRLALQGTPRPTRLGEINDHVFLINASMGLYAKVIQERKKNMNRFGRHRLVGTLSTIFSLLKGHAALKVIMLVDGVRRHFKTPMIFIGNNALQLRDLSFDVHECMKADKLAVVMLKPASVWQVLGIIFRGLTKTMSNEQSLHTFCVESLSIRSHKDHYTVALDGELFKMSSPLRIASRPGALNLIRP